MTEPRNTEYLFGYKDMLEILNITAGSLGEDKTRLCVDLMFHALCRIPTEKYPRNPSDAELQDMLAYAEKYKPEMTNTVETLLM